jgi:hypothetical protein
MRLLGGGKRGLLNSRLACGGAKLRFADSRLRPRFSSAVFDLPTVIRHIATPP